MPQQKETPQEEKVLENALSPIVNRLIDKNFANSGDKIATQIAPLIGGAIREQIKSQKDDIVDALYPVMGNMISKFVTKSLEELLHKINEQIQHGLSVNAIKRKIKAKVKGVSETELLLQESSHAKIKAALLIDKESGSLLCKVEDENASLTDADMLASMMSAIRSFVNEWVESNEKHHELGEIEYGGNKIIIEASGYSYLAVIVEGAAYRQTYEKIRHTLEKIILHYGDDIKNFNGNFELFPKEAIKTEMLALLKEESAQSEPEDKKISPLLWVLPLLLIGYFSYLFYQDYQDENYEKRIEKLISQSPTLSPFKIDVIVDNKVATITGRLPFKYHKDLVEKLLQKVDGLKAVHNEIKITPTLTDPMQVSANIAYLLKGLNLNKHNNIDYNFDYNKLALNGYVTNKETKEKLLKALKTIQGIQTIEDHIEVKSPEFHTDLYFKTASSELNNSAKERLLELVKIIKDSKTTAPISIKAYSDMVGEVQSNRALAQKRVKSIKNFLQEQNHLTNEINTEIFDRPPEGVDAKKEPHKARCIKVALESKKSHV